MREVDVYAPIRGKAGGWEIAVAVECVNRSRKMDVTWVEGMFGKHSVLQVADVVLLVSAKGFYHSAVVKATRFGYKTISPAISEERLATTIFGTDSPKMGMNIGHMELVGVQAQMSAVGLTPDFAMVEPDVNVCGYRRADGTELVKAKKYAVDTVLKKPRGRGSVSCRRYQRKTRPEGFAPGGCDAAREHGSTCPLSALPHGAAARTTVCMFGSLKPSDRSSGLRSFGL
jgi:hypothetical protein